MSAKPVTFKKRTVAGSCRAMRCKVKEPEPLYEFETGDPLIGVALLCEGHYRRAAENKQAPAPVGPAAERVDTDAVLQGPYGYAKSGTAEQTAVVVEHAPVLALVEPLRTEYTGMASQLVALVIDSQERVDMAGQLLVQVNGKLKQLDTQRLSITRPLREATAAVNALFRPAVDAATSVVKMLKSGLADYDMSQKRLVTTHLAAGNHEAGLAVVQPTMPAGVSTRTVWKWRIANMDIIPREYWVIDSAKVQAHVNANKGNSAIPGVEAYCETGISARTP